MIYVLYDCVCVPTDFVYIVVRVLILPFGTFNDLISSFLSVFAVNLLTTREWPHIQLPRTDAGVLRRYATRSQKGLFTARGVWPRSRHPPVCQSVCTWPACHHSPTATVDRLQQLTGRRYNSEQATSHGPRSPPDRPWGPRYRSPVIQPSAKLYILRSDTINTISSVVPPRKPPSWLSDQVCYR